MLAWSSKPIWWFNLKKFEAATFQNGKNTEVSVIVKYAAKTYFTFDQAVKTEQRLSTI